MGLGSQKFFTDFEFLAKQLGYRGIERKQLLFIKNKLIRQRELIWIKNNRINWEINQLSKRGKEYSEFVKRTKKVLVCFVNKELDDLNKELDDLISQLPNLPAPEVPLKENEIVSKTEYEHQIEKNQPTFDQIVHKLGLVNDNFGIKLSGSKFVVYQGLGSRLVRALINFMLAEQQKRG
jgi:seryl-tRNA synthetase